MELKTQINTYLSLFEGEGRHAKINNFQLLILAKSGYGKGLASEGIVEELHRQGYLILIIADPKSELEYGFVMFEPKAWYHIDQLKLLGKTPLRKDVKLYHPFTFDISTNKLPEINFFTFSLKDMNRSSWGMLAESSFESDTVSLLIDASQNISKEDGIFGLAHYIQDSIKGKKEGRSTKADPKNFYLSSTRGTVKSLQEMSKYLSPFKRDYFLTKDNCHLKLNWKEIFSNQKSYHFFITNFIKDEKLQEFVVLNLLNQIIANKNLAKNPVCIVIPEIRKLCPYRPMGYKFFLSEGIKNNLSTMRSMGRGISSIMDSQVWEDIDEDVSDSATITLIGELGGARDIEKFSKAMNYKRDVRDKLKRMEHKNSFFIGGREDPGAITIFFPSHAHCEEEDSFFERYHQEYYDRERKYTDLIFEMKKTFKQEEEKFKEKVRKKQKEERERKEREKRESEEQSNVKEKADDKFDRAKEIERKSKQQLMKLVYEEKEKEPEISWRELGRRFDINVKTAQKYYSDYEKIIEEESGESYEDKFLENDSLQPSNSS